MPDRLDSDIVARYEGREVTVGIRPEDIHLEAEYMEGPAAGILDARVDIAEMMGSEILLYAAFGKDTLIAKVAVKNKLGPGDEIRLAIDCNKIHLFDKETEQAIA